MELDGKREKSVFLRRKQKQVHAFIAKRTIYWKAKTDVEGEKEELLKQGL